MSDTKQALGPNQLAWLEALESGKYQQGRDWLCYDGRYCCLGVAAKIFGVPERPSRHDCKRIVFDGSCTGATDMIIETLAMRGPSGESDDDIDAKCLQMLNDGGKTFAEIAAIIRSDPAVYFKEPK